jgi:hypothetical protein
MNISSMIMKLWKQIKYHYRLIFLFQKLLNLIFEKSKKTVEKTISIIYTINIFNVLSCAGKR